MVVEISGLNLPSNMSQKKTNIHVHLLGRYYFSNSAKHESEIPGAHDAHGLHKNPTETHKTSWIMLDDICGQRIYSL